MLRRDRQEEAGHRRPSDQGFVIACIRVEGERAVHHDPSSN